MSALDVQIEGRAATVLLNRPDALNSLSSAVLEEIDSTLALLGEDREVHGVIVTGAGRAFSAGADIEEIARLDGVSGRSFAERGQRAFDRIEGLSKPVIAAVNGFALGGGCELALACHVRIASSHARFGQPEVKLGALPGFGGTQRLPRVIGRSAATEIIITGRIVDAEEAQRLGLVSELVEPEALIERANEILDAVGRNGPAAVAASLRAIRDGADGALADGLALEAKLFGELSGSDEMREGTRAFLDKRDPRFRD